ncbi:MAG: cytochrome b/b6 domain-containing protein [Verrucomicrobiota bacterium]
MLGKWTRIARLVHKWLGVFFAPLLLLFTITGWWQTFADDDTKNHGPINAFLAQLSNIHTDDYFFDHAGQHHGSGHFKLLVGLMAALLIVSILLGLLLACQNAKQARWAAVAFVLGILVPALILFFN